MKLMLYSLATLLFFQAAVSVSEGSLCPLLKASGVSSSEKTGSYIVVLKEETSHEMFLNIKSQIEHLSTDAKLHGSVEKVAKAFTVRLTDLALNIVRSLPQVKYVEEETMVHGTQMNNSVIWHVDRLDQYYLPLDNTYQPNGTGEGVDIYILDTGINYNHEEFEGRAEYGGYDAVDVHYYENRRGSDCDGHGTHVASLAAGKTYGTAKNATLYSIRVLDCYSNGRYGMILDAFEYLATTIPARGRPAVISMSLSGSYSYTFDDAITEFYSQGMIMVVAAGNNGYDACYYSPASSSHVITVGGSAQGDQLYRDTNVGSCVDIFAPGANIVAAGYSCDYCSASLSGTSMATPKVTGIAALHLEKDPDLTPDEMKEKLTSTATPDVLNFSSIQFRYRSITPNRLLYIGPAVSVDCKEPPEVSNGSVVFSGVTPGSVATYTCSPEFTLVGEENRTCNFLGNWSNKEPRCLKLCPDIPYYFPNGYRYYSQYGALLTEGIIVYYSCYYRYTLLGSGTRVCQSDGTWSGEEPRCVRQCPRLYSIDNGRIIGDIENRTVGTIVTYTCDEGFTLIGPENRTCLTYGWWSNHEPVCEPVPPPPVVQGLCSVVVWYSPDFPCRQIIRYDVMLYSPQSEDQADLIHVDADRTYYIIPVEENATSSYDHTTYVKVRAVSRTTEGEWNDGIPLGCDAPTEAPEIHNVYFELNGQVYYNNSAISIEDVGEGRNALLCKTDKEDCCRVQPNRYGEFYYPNGTQVPIRTQQHGFYRQRGEQQILLNRRDGIVSPTGKYRCKIPEASGAFVNIYITLTI